MTMNEDRYPWVTEWHQQQAKDILAKDDFAKLTKDDPTRFTKNDIAALTLAIEYTRRDPSRNGLMIQMPLLLARMTMRGATVPTKPRDWSRRCRLWASASITLIQLRQLSRLNVRKVEAERRG
jgi:hypothetical protein